MSGKIRVGKSTTIEELKEKFSNCPEVLKVVDVLKSVRNGESYQEKWEKCDLLDKSKITYNREQDERYIVQILDIQCNILVVISNDLIMRKKGPSREEYKMCQILSRLIGDPQIDADYLWKREKAYRISLISL